MSIWDDLGDAADDVGDVVSSAADAVGDAVEGVVDGAADAADNVVGVVIDWVTGAVNSAVTWFDEHTFGALGFVAKLIGGVVNGILKGFRDIVHDVVSVVKDAIGIFAAVLRLDFGGLVQKIANLVLDVIHFAIDVVRYLTGGYIVGGVIGQFEREALREFVKQLLQNNFGSDPALLDRINDRVNITTASWGLPVTGNHYVFMLDSQNTPLWQWHQDGTLDLYALAGVLTIKSAEVQRPRTWVRSVGSDGKDNFFPVTRLVITDYLSSQGANRRLRVYAMDTQAVAERLDVAVAKCKTLGIKLSWNDGTAVTSGMFTTLEITKKSEFNFDLNQQESFPLEHGLRTGNRVEECTLLALGAFYLDPPNNGRTAGRNIAEGDSVNPCGSMGRDDGCCSTIPQPTIPPTVSSSVIHRDKWPSIIFRYVLAHEIGHYFGLCHYGHDGIQNIMFTLEPDANLSLLDPGELKFYYSSEPDFTLSDGKNAWRFIVSQLRCCLDSTLVCAAPIENTGMITQGVHVLKQSGISSQKINSSRHLGFF